MDFESINLKKVFGFLMLAIGGMSLFMGLWALGKEIPEVEVKSKAFLAQRVLPEDNPDSDQFVPIDASTTPEVVERKETAEMRIMIETGALEMSRGKATTEAIIGFVALVIGTVMLVFFSKRSEVNHMVDYRP